MKQVGLPGMEQINYQPKKRSLTPLQLEIIKKKEVTAMFNEMRKKSTSLFDLPGISGTDNDLSQEIAFATRRAANIAKITIKRINSYENAMFRDYITGVIIKALKVNSVVSNIQDAMFDDMIRGGEQSGTE